MNLEETLVYVGSLLCAYGLLVCMLPFLFILLEFALLSWVAQDCRKRRMDSLPWLFLILFTGFVGLGLYLALRLEVCHGGQANRL